MVSTTICNLPLNVTKFNAITRQPQIIPSCKEVVFYSPEMYLRLFYNFSFYLPGGSYSRLQMLALNIRLDQNTLAKEIFSLLQFGLFNCLCNTEQYFLASAECQMRAGNAFKSRKTRDENFKDNKNDKKW